MAGRIQPPAKLLESALAGDMEAREALWGWVLDTVIRLARAIGPGLRLRMDDELDDIVQETVLSVIAKTPQELAGVEHWEAWLARIVRARCIDFIRRRARRPNTISLEQPIGDDSILVEFIANPGGAPDICAQISEILDFVDRQGKENATLFRLYVMGYTQKEIAALQALPQSTVNNRIYRVLKAVREHFR